MVLATTDSRNQARYAFAWRARAGATEATRQALYQELEGYYYGTIWPEKTQALMRQLAGWAENATIEGIYNPVKTIVDFYRDYCLGGRLGEEGAAAVTATIQTEQSGIIRPLLDVWRWSGLETRRDLIGRFGALLGNALLVVVDDARPETPDQAKVWIEVRHPGELVDWEFDTRGNLTLARLAEQREERGPTGIRQTYRYERLLTKTAYATYRDGYLYEYRRLPDGTPVRPPAGTNPTTGRPWQPGEWPNPHGFVPVRLVKHEEGGDIWGYNAWYHIIPAIDELNRRASHIGDLIGQHMAAQWAVLGASAPARTTAAGGVDEEPFDRGSMLYLPDGTDIKAVVAQIDFANAYTHPLAILTWLREQCPELSLSELLKKSGDLSGVAVQKILMPLLKKAEKAQDLYSSELIRACQMALTMGANVGGSGRDLWRERHGATLGRYEDGALDFRFHWRDIVPLTDLEQMQVDAQRESLTDEIQQRQAMRAEGAAADQAMAAERRPRPLSSQREE